MSINQFGLGTTTTKNHALESNDLADSGSFQSSTAAVQVLIPLLLYVKFRPHGNASTVVHLLLSLVFSYSFSSLKVRFEVLRHMFLAGAG